MTQSAAILPIAPLEPFSVYLKAIIKINLKNLKSKRKKNYLNMTISISHNGKIAIKVA